MLQRRNERSPLYARSEFHLSHADGGRQIVIYVNKQLERLQKSGRSGKRFTLNIKNNTGFGWNRTETYNANRRIAVVKLERNAFSAVLADRMADDGDVKCPNPYSTKRNSTGNGHDIVSILLKQQLAGEIDASMITDRKNLYAHSVRVHRNSAENRAMRIKGSDGFRRLFERCWIGTLEVGPRVASR